MFLIVPVLLTLWLSISPAIAAEGDLGWRDPVSETVRVSKFSPTVAAELLADLQRREEADRTRIIAATQARMDLAVGAAFTAMNGRVVAYADWIYGWISSYAISYKLALVATESVTRQFAEGDTTALMSRTEDDLVGYVADRFETSVVRSEEVAGAFERGWRDALAFAEKLDRALADRRRSEFTARLLVEGIPAADPARARLTATMVDPGRRLIDARQIGEIDFKLAPLGGEQGPANVILLRSLRPLALRMASWSVRLMLAVGVGSAVGIPALGGAGGISSALITGLSAIGALWTLDYLINAVDARLYRASMERRLIAVVATARREISDQLLGELSKRMALQR